MPVPAKSASPGALVADELGSLEKEYETLIAPFKLKLPRIEALRKQLRELCTVPADAPWVVSGINYEVTLGPKAKSRSVDVAKLLKRIGLKLFTKVATVTITALESECPTDVVDAVVTEARTGPRSIKIIEKGK